MKYFFYLSKLGYSNENRNCSCEITHKRFDKNHICRPNCYISEECRESYSNTEKYEIKITDCKTVDPKQSYGRSYGSSEKI